MLIVRLKANRAYRNTKLIIIKDIPRTTLAPHSCQIVIFVLVGIAHRKAISLVVDNVAVIADALIVVGVVFLVLFAFDGVGDAGLCGFGYVVAWNAVASWSKLVVCLETVGTLFYASVVQCVEWFIEGTVVWHLAGFCLWVVNHAICAPNLAFSWGCVVILTICWTLVALRNASSSQVIKYLSTFAFNCATNSNTNMILSAVISYCAITIIFTFFRFRI